MYSEPLFVVQFLKSYREINFVLRALHTIVTSSLVTFDFIFALLIIDLTLDIVGQHLVSPVNLCELLCSFLVARVLSGWYSREAFLNAFLIAAVSASLETFNRS